MEKYHIFFRITPIDGTYYYVYVTCSWGQSPEAFALYAMVLRPGGSDQGGHGQRPTLHAGPEESRGGGAPDVNFASGQDHLGEAFNFEQ